MASNIDAWNTPISCFNCMLNVEPRDFCKLVSILFCKAEPGVGGTVLGVLFEMGSNLKG